MMRKVGRLSFVIVLILLMCIAAGCGENDEQAVGESDKNEITIIDSSGAEIVLPDKLSKVAVLNPANVNSKLIQLISESDPPMIF